MTPHAAPRRISAREPWFPLLIVIVLALFAFVTLRRIGRESRLRIAVLHSLAMVADAEEAYHVSHHTYAGTLGGAGVSGAISVLPDSGAMITIVHADSTGWTAEGAHPALGHGTRRCHIYGGNAPHDPRLRTPGEPDCW
jgi:hypothetical protein